MRLSHLAVTASLLCLLVVSCIDDNENGSLTSTHGSRSSMDTGRDCIACHTSGSEEGEFIVAGTVYQSNGTSVYPNSTVYLYTGADGTGSLAATIEVDGRGNLYTSDRLSFGSGLYPVVRGSDTTQVAYMGSVITSGSCNAAGCHDAGSRVSVP